MLLQQEAYSLVHPPVPDSSREKIEKKASPAPKLSPAEREQKLVNLSAIALLGSIGLILGFMVYLLLPL